MKKFVIIKLIGLSILVMASLIFVSFIEVAIYSYLINPGQDVSIYDAHALKSAPYISGLFGLILFFFIARFWVRKNYSNIALLIWLFPIIYLTIDFLIFLLAQVDFSEFMGVFLLTNTFKFLGSYAGYKFNKIVSENK